ncbi:MAG TPA: ABC transporter permease, partial [Thermoanaerobaculia bacterium]|nr:ABC transporter permease [Thermoanaerobaculia bacterium]
MWFQDLRYAMRSLTKRPGFTLAIILILALGIGATTAIFSVTDAIILRPLPYPEADRLMFFYESLIGEDADTSSVAYLDYVEWKQRSTSFEEMAASASWLRLNLNGGERPERVHVNFVSTNYFKLLGAEPLLGRTFLLEEDIPSRSPVAILTNGFWKRYYGGDPEILGKTLSLNERPVTIVGILPEDFHDISQDTEIFLPVTSISVLISPTYLENRPSRWVHPVARLKRGVTTEQARAELDAIAASLAERFPENRGIGAKFEPVSEVIFEFEDLRTSTLVMMIASSLLMLICCINVTNLLILRSMERQREIALRLTLGSSHVRLVRQLAMEGMILALLGGVVGIFLGFAGTRLLVRASALDLPNFAAITVNTRVVAVALLISLVTGVIFGLLPALRSRKVDLRESLQQGAAQSSGGPRRELGRRLLIIAEVALALVLLLNAGLMVKSFSALRQDRVGVDSENLLVLRMNLDSPRYAEREARSFFAEELMTRAANFPGASAVGIWGPGVPGAEAHFGLDLLPEVSETADTEQEARFVRRHHITPGALRALGITLRKGREFTPADVAGQQRVAIVSETMAREFWPGQEAIGKRFKPALPPGSPEVLVTVVGIAADVRHGGRVWEARGLFPRDVYLPLAQSPERQLTLWIRTEQDAATLGPELRKLVQSIDPNLPVFDLATMAERRFEEEAQFRFRAILVALFAVVALVLTSVGIYTVLSYAVSQRTREIGIRSALGAQHRDVLGLVISQGLVLFAVGAVIGLVGATFSRKLVSSLLYGITPNDPSTWALILAVLAAVTLVAIYIPARRALKVEPVIA